MFDFQYNHQFSTIVCTANRDRIVVLSIQSIIKDLGGEAPLFIVDNNNDKELSNNVKELVDTHDNVFLRKEDQQGLSYARNKMLDLDSDWIIFLDDDVQIPTNFFDTAKQIIESEQFDCFGGMYYPWYPIGEKPRWLAEDFGKKPPLTTKTAPINVLKDGCLSAGVMAVKTTALQAIGGFRTDLGMTNAIGYGEEDDMQIRLQAAGYRIGFVPDWFLYHAVLPHKQKVGWHLRAAHARARDAQRIYNKNTKTQIIVFLLQLIPFTILVKIPRSLFRLVFKKDYYWQNAVLDSIQSIYSNIGKLQAVFTTTSPAPKKDEE